MCVYILLFDRINDKDNLFQYLTLEMLFLPNNLPRALHIIILRVYLIFHSSTQRMYLTKTQFNGRYSY